MHIGCGLPRGLGWVQPEGRVHGAMRSLKISRSVLAGRGHTTFGLPLVALLAWSTTAQAQGPPPAPSPAPSDSAPPASPPPSEPPPAPPAASEPASQAPAPREEPVEVRVIGSKPDSLQRIPGSGTVITPQDIKRADPFTLAEMLNRVPGVVARQEEGGGFRLDIGIRGLDPGRSRHELILEDGVPVSLNPYAEPDMYYAPPIERMRGIEVVKGSGSILFGPQTIGGVINFLTLAPPSREHVALDAEYGERNYARALGQYGNTFGSARYIVQAFYKRGDGFRNEAFESTDVLSKVAFDTSKIGEATLKLGFHDDSAYSDDVGLTRAMYAQDPSRPTLAPHDHEHLQKFDASLIDEERFGANTKLRTLVYAYQTSRIWRRQDFVRNPYDPNNPSSGEPAGFERFVGDNNIPGGGIYFLNTDTVLDRTYDVAGLEPKIEHRFTSGPVGHTLETGARLLGETAHYQQRTGTTFDSDSGSNDSEERHRTIAVAGYASDRIAFRDDLLVTPGFRLEHAEFHRIVLRQLLPTCPAGVLRCSQDVNLQGDYGATGVIPGIGMIYGSKDAHVFGGLHVGWSPPRVASSYSPKGTPLPVSPEQSINYEVGTRVAPAKWARGEVTGFITSFQNQVIPGTSAQGAELVDGGPTRHVGVEGAANVGIGRALKWGTIVDVGARYTFARATFVGGTFDGNLLPYAPLHSFNANLDVEHPIGLGGQVFYSHISSQFADQNDTRAVDATGQFGLMPAYNVLDANAHYHHKPSGLTFRVAVKNALDDLYIIARRPQGIFVSGFREVIVGLRWDWDAKERVE
jgi:Fe(3+) dicitrate transport protein